MWDFKVEGNMEYAARSCEAGMTQDEIIRMAREAGLQLNVYAETYPVIAQQLERFAALVAAHSFNDGWIKGNKGLMEAVREEREACAKACETLETHGYPNNRELKCAAAIRARGEK